MTLVGSERPEAGPAPVKYSDFPQALEYRFTWVTLVSTGMFGL